MNDLNELMSQSNSKVKQGVFDEEAIGKALGLIDDTHNQKTINEAVLNMILKSVSMEIDSRFNNGLLHNKKEIDYIMIIISEKAKKYLKGHLDIRHPHEEFDYIIKLSPHLEFNVHGGGKTDLVINVVGKNHNLLSGYAPKLS